MPLVLPSLTDLRSRVATDLQQQTGLDAQTPGTGATELANVIAATAHALYGNQQWLGEQLSIDTADDTVLLRRAATFGISRIPAAYATGTVTVTGNTNAVIQNGTVLQHSDGRQYRVTAETSISNGSTTVNLIALEAGINSHLNADDLRFITPLTGVDIEATAATVTGGADAEPIARVRDRLRNRLQQTPMGGRDYDYVQWARQGHADVTRAWVFAHENGIGSMVVRFVTENIADPIPTTAHINAVRNEIENFRPAGLRSLSVEAPARREINIAFTRLLPNTPEVQQAVELELLDLFGRVSAPGQTLYLSQVREAVSNATGETDFVFDLNANIELANNEFAVLGAITWPGQ